MDYVNVKALAIRKKHCCRSIFEFQCFKLILCDCIVAEEIYFRIKKQLFYVIELFLSSTTNVPYALKQ